jgi:hypothetical protein
VLVRVLEHVRVAVERFCWVFVAQDVRGGSESANDIFMRNMRPLAEAELESSGGRFLTLGGGDNRGNSKPALPWPPSGHRDGKQMQQMMNAIGSAFGEGISRAHVEQMVRMANYPWWWLPVKGYDDIERVIHIDMAMVRLHSWYSPEMKGVILANLGVALNVARRVWNVFPQ